MNEDHFNRRFDRIEEQVSKLSELLGRIVIMEERGIALTRHVDTINQHTQNQIATINLSTERSLMALRENQDRREKDMIDKIKEVETAGSQTATEVSTMKLQLGRWGAYFLVGSAVVMAIVPPLIQHLISKIIP